MNKGLGSSPQGDRFSSRYKIQKQLGKRAGRQTLLARDIITQELVVIKVLSFGSDFEWDDLKLFEREAETLKSLFHPAIPRYLDYFKLDSPAGKKLVLVQTYIEAKSLEEHLKAGRTFSQAETKQIASSLLEILIYLHGRQPPVIHRDIKPSNILLTDRSGNSVGQVYLVDFGSVQTLAAREGGTITVVGTYGYMPQEQFGGRTVPASDLYSLGATLIYLVTGTHPADLPQKDFRIQFEQACNLSPAISSWLRWMTEPTLDRRLGSAAQALQVLEQEQPTTEITPLVVRKPSGSKVQLTKNANSLEILLPSWGLTCNSGLASFIFFLIFSVNLAAFFIFFLSFSISLTMMPYYFVSPNFWLSFLCLGGVARRLGKIRLRIDRQQISLSYKLFGLQLYRRSYASSTRDISINFIRQYQEIWWNIPASLMISVGINKYEITGQNFVWGQFLTESEIGWLACEISEWLRMPFEK